MTNRWIPLALALALSLVAAACSSDSGSDDVAVDAPAAQEPEPEAEPATDSEEMDDEEMADEEMDDEEMDDEEMDDEEMAGALELSFTNLPELAEGSVYEGWLIVDDVPVSTGVFDAAVPAAVVPEGAEAATAFVLTIEPADDPDPAPAATHVLAGDLVDGRAELTTAHAAAIGTDFADASGRYILATPTNGTGADERSGIWWTDIPRAQSLFLPTLPDGWIYEGWAVIDGVPVTSGTFRDPFATDDAAPFSGPQEGPPLPGEDYLQSAPDGLTFPTDLRGQTIVVSVEPVPDTSPDPFAIKPLVGSIPADAADHVVYDQQNVVLDTLPAGLAVLS